jgi:hypothetical protein
MTQWRRLDALHQRAGPLIIAMTRTGFREIDLDARLGELRGQAVQRRQLRRSTPPEGAGDELRLF